MKRSYLFKNVALLWSLIKFIKRNEKQIVFGITVLAKFYKHFSKTTMGKKMFAKTLKL